MIQLQADLHNSPRPLHLQDATWVLKPAQGRVDLPTGQIAAGEFVIGSAADCDLVIPISGVAPHHCRLFPEGQRMLLLADDSRTWVNDGPLRKGRLKSGDRITLGPVTLQLEICHSPDFPPGEVSPFETHLARYLQKITTHAELPRVHSEVETYRALDEVQESIRQTQQQLWKQKQSLHAMSGPEMTPADSILHQPLPELLGGLAPLEEPQGRQQVPLTAKPAVLSESLVSVPEAQYHKRQLERLLQLKNRLRHQFVRRHSRLQTAEILFEERQRETEKLSQEYQNRLRELDQREAVRSEQEQKWTEQLRRINDESERLQQLLELAEQENQTLTQQLQTLEVQMAESAAHAVKQQELEEQITELSTYARKLEDQASQYKIHSEELQHQLHRCQQELEQKSSAVAVQLAEAGQKSTEWETLLNDYRLREETLHTQIAKIEQERTQIAAECENLHQLRDQLDVEKQSLLTTTEQLKADLARAQQAVADHSIEQSSLEEEWDRLSAERDRMFQLREQLEEERQAFTQAHEDLRAVREEAEQQQRQQQEDLQARQEELIAESIRLETLRNTLEQEQSDVPAPSESVNALLLREEIAPQKEDEAPQRDASPQDSGRTIPTTDLEDLAETIEWKDDVSTEVESVAADAEEDSLGALKSLFSELESFSILDTTAIPESEVEFSPLNESPLPVDEEEATSDALITTPLEDELQNLRPTAEFDSSSTAPSSQEDESKGENEEPLALQTPEEGQASDEEMFSESEDAASSIDDGLGKLRHELAQMFGFHQTPREPLAADFDEAEEADSPTDQHALEERLLAETDDDQAALLQSSLFAQNFSDDSDEDSESQIEPSLTNPVSPPKQVDQPVPERDMVVEDIEDADSVAAYMQRLFARTNGKQNYAEPATYQPSPQRAKPRQETVAVATTGVTAEVSSNPPPPSPTKSTPVDRIRPVVQLDRELMKREIESLRDVANQTARNALATHAWKQVKLKMLASGILTLVSGISAFILISSPYWSPISYQNYGWLTLLLTGVSAVELFRSRLGLMRLTQSKKQQNLSEILPDVDASTDLSKSENNRSV